jgi:hypothetical protein
MLTKTAGPLQSMTFLGDKFESRDVSCSCFEGGVTEQFDDRVNPLRADNCFVHFKIRRYVVVFGQLPWSLVRLPSTGFLSEMGWPKGGEKDTLLARGRNVDCQWTSQAKQESATKELC